MGKNYGNSSLYYGEISRETNERNGLKDIGKMIKRMEKGN